MYFSLKYIFKVFIRRSISKMANSVSQFKLSQYDVVGLDFDNTIVQYNLSELFQLHYKYMSNYLIEKKGYNGLSSTMNEEDVDFIQKGLFMDFNKGNILKISANGQIIKASHGTKKLTTDDIIQTYGTDMRWEHIDSFINNKKISINSEHTYSFLDFTDCTAILVYGKAIDLVDLKTKSEYKQVWIDVLEAIIKMYDLNSEFMLKVAENINVYLNKCDGAIIDWLNQLKENTKLMLISSATPQTLHFVANYCLGKNWKNLFHTIIDLAKKPTFFHSDKPYFNINNEQIELNNSSGYYRHGNWRDMHRLLTEELGRPVKSVYIGDNILQDVYAPSLSGDIHLETVAIVEESLAEGYYPGYHPHDIYIKSNYWGSYFEENGVPTLMGDILMKHTKLVVPLIKYLADKPLDYEHRPFCITSSSSKEK